MASKNKHPFRNHDKLDFQTQRNHYAQNGEVKRKLLWGVSEDFRLATQDMHVYDNLTIGLIQETEQLKNQNEVSLYKKLSPWSLFSAEGMAVFSKIYFPPSDQSSYYSQKSEKIAHRQSQILPLYDFVAFFGDPKAKANALTTAAQLVKNFNEELDKVSDHSSGETPSCSVQLTIAWGTVNQHTDQPDLRWVVQYSLFNFQQQQQKLRESGHSVFRKADVADVRVSFFG